MFKLTKHKLATFSIKQALKQQGLMPMYEELEEILPDISDQYTGTELNSEYSRVNVRAMHAFQAILMLQGVGLIEKSRAKGDLPTSLRDLRVVDIGDSSGNHILYLKGLFKEKNIDSLSVNVDLKAVEKIKGKGLDAVQMSAEQFARSTILRRVISPADMVMMFELLEHLENPVCVLKKSNVPIVVLTVPFVRRSQVGLHYLREKKGGEMPEDVHVFELSPNDWGLLFTYTGWEVVYEQVYYQYPSRLRWPGKWLWRWKDFEGFYGYVLRKNPTRQM